MSIQSRHTSFATVAALSAAALLLSGCAGTEDSTGEERPGAEMSQEIHDMLPDRIKDSGVIAVGTEAFYPPYDYFDDDETTIVGLDPDIVHALGDVLGVEMKLEHMAFDGLLPALDAKRIDMVTGALGVNADRVAKYDFVSYFNTPQGITVLADNPKGVESRDDLCGLNVSVLDASHQLNLLEEMNGDICSGNPMNIMAFPADSDALQQLQNGRADAHLAQYPVAAYNAETFGGGDTFLAISEDAFGPYILGKVFRKDDTELRDAVQAAMNELIESGVYQEILEAHGLESGAIERSEINPL